METNDNSQCIDDKRKAEDTPRCGPGPWQVCLQIDDCTGLVCGAVLLTADRDAHPANLVPLPGVTVDGPAGLTGWNVSANVREACERGEKAMESYERSREAGKELVRAWSLLHDVAVNDMTRASAYLLLGEALNSLGVAIEAMGVKLVDQ